MAKRTARGQRAAKARTAAIKAGKPAAAKRAAAVMKAEKEAAKVERQVRAGTKTFADLAAGREEAMEERAERFKGRTPIVGPRGQPAAGVPSLQATVAAANEARAYADAMRRITERQKGERTPYTGAGITDVDGVGDIDAQAYRDRFMEPGVTTPFQDVNIQQMLEQPGQDLWGKRENFRQNIWGDTWDDATGRWVRGDREEAIAEQQRRLDAGNVPVPTWSGLLDSDLDQSNLNQLNRKQGTSAFQHPYAADPYKVPHMETGGLWEGLGAEYQPGTVEGLGLLAGKAYAPYEPLRQGLLNARPSFMGTPSGFEPINFEGGLSGETETSNNAWSPSWQFRGSGANQQYGYFTEGGQWIGHNTASKD